MSVKVIIVSISVDTSDHDTSVGHYENNQESMPLVKRLLYLSLHVYKSQQVYEGHFYIKVYK